MHISPREVRDMLLWDYEATLVRWNEAHEVDTDPEPATVEDVEGTIAFFDAHPELLN